MRVKLLKFKYPQRTFIQILNWGLLVQKTLFLSLDQRLILNFHYLRASDPTQSIPINYNGLREMAYFEKIKKMSIFQEPCLEGFKLAQ